VGEDVRVSPAPPGETVAGEVENTPVAAVPLSDALHTLSTVALATSGGALFGTPILMLFIQRSVVSPIDVAMVAVLGVAWLSCLAIPRLSVRATAQSGIGIVLVASPLLLGNASGGPWMPVTLVGFAIVVGAVFALSRNAALVIVFGVALVQAAVLRIAPVGAAFTEVQLSLIAGPLLTILAGVGLVIAFDEWRREARVLDVRQEELEAAQEATEQQVRIQRAQENVERRIHETVLNTLTAISMGQARVDLAQRRARRDLEQLELGVQPLEDTALSRVIDVALATSGADEIPHDVRIASDGVIPGPIATALRDATVEALRNVVRHAQASRIRIDVNMQVEMESARGTGIEIVISDDGVGMSAEVVERFGMRSAMRHGVESVSGSVSIQSEPGRGTTVTLRAPRVADFPLVSEPTEATSLLDDSRASRLGLLGTNVFLAIFAITFALALPATPVVLAAIAVFVAGNVILAWVWTPIVRRWLPPFVIASGAMALVAPVVASPGALACSVDDSSAWLVAGISGGGALLLISAYRNLAARLAVVAVIGAATVVLSLAVDSACRDFTLLSSIVTLVYMAAIAGFLTWIDMRFDAQRFQRMKLWHDIVISQADMVSRQAAAEQWNTLTASTRSLLEGVASGQLDPLDPVISAEAETEGSSLRARLGRGRTEPGGLVELLDQLRPVARRYGCAVEVTEITEWQRTDALPDWLSRATCDVVASGAAERIGLVVLHDDGVDELLMTLPVEAAQALRARIPHDTGDCVVEVEEQTHSGLVMLSVRRRC